MLCICMGVVSCAAFGEDPEWEDAVPVEDAGCEAEEFILNEDPADAQAADSMQEPESEPASEPESEPASEPESEPASEPASEELQEPEEDLLSELIEDDPAADEELIEAEELLSDDELFEATPMAANDEVVFNGQYAVLLKSDYTTSKLISLGCEGKILRSANGILNIHVNQDMSVKGIVCNNSDSSLWIGGSAVLTVASDDSYGESGMIGEHPGTYYRAVRAARIIVAEHPTIKADIFLSSGGICECSMLWAKDTITVNGGTLLLGTQYHGHYGLKADNDIIIKDGIIKPSCSCGIESEEGSVTISGGTFDCAYTSGSTGIHSRLDTIINGGKLNIKVSSSAIYANRKLIINGGSLTAEGGNYVLDGGAGIDIHGGTVKAVSRSDGYAKNYGAVCSINGSFKMTGGTVIADASAGSGHGVCVDYNGTNGSTMDISGGTLVAKGGSTSSFGNTYNGIAVGGSVNITGGDVTCTGEKTGLFIPKPSGTLYISDGILEASGGERAAAFKAAPFIGANLAVLDPVAGKPGNTVIDGVPWSTITNSKGDTAAYVLIGKGYYTVTFNANGRGTAPAAQKLAIGRCAVEPAAPSASGYIFGGWYKDAACTAAWSFSTPVSGNLTLYAKWDAPGVISGDVTPSTPVTAAAAEKTILGMTGEKDTKGATYGLLKAKGKATSKSSIKLTWSKIKGATSYVIYGNKCGKKNKYLRITSVKGTSYTQKKLKKNTYYKYLIVAVNGKTALAVSKTIHVATRGGKKGNFTGLKLSKTKASLKKKKTVKIRSTAKQGRLKVSVHRKVAWESSNPKVATVNSKGRIKAISKGTCYIYAYTQNGICKKVKVKVK